MATPVLNGRGQPLSAKQIVIQCPACQTKFALDSTSLEGVDKPRFHCSRCDRVFGMEESRVAALPVGTLTKRPSSAYSPFHPQQDEPPPSNPISRSDTTSRAAPQSNQRTEIAARTAFSIRGTQSAPIPSQLENDDPPAPTPDLGTQMSLNLPKSEELPSARNKLPQFSLRDIEPEEREFDDRADQQESFERSNSAQVGNPGSIPSAEAIKAALEAGFNNRTRAADDDDDSNLLEVSEEERFAAFERLERREASRASWKGLGIVSGVFLTFLLILGGISFYLRGNTEGATALVKSFFPSAQRLAPEGLYIKNSHIRRLTLDNGDTVQIVSGRITNQTNESFGDITIEAIAFDGAGTPLLRTRVSASNTLVHTRIRSLTPDMIKNIQSEMPSPIYRLKKGTTEEFAIALANGEQSELLNRARFFTARIYSVRG